MKIVHLIHSIAAEASGPSYAVRHLCESLVENRIDVVLAVLDYGTISSCPSFMKTFALGMGPSRLGLSPHMNRWLIKQADQRYLDILHSHSLWMMPNVYPGWIARKYDIPFVASPHGTLTKYAMGSGSKIKRVFWPLVQRPALNAVTCFHATAASEYEDIRRLGFAQPVAIIPNAVDVPVHRPMLNDNERTLLFLGRIHPEKGVDILLRSWGAVSTQFPEWRLKIVGPDIRGYLPIMKALAKTLRLERVDFADALYGEAKINAYRSADLFVLPSPSENFGVAVAESLAAGTPVVATKGAPWAGLASHQAGWWIDIDVDPLVDCMKVALATPRDVLQSMGKRGREWVEADFSWAEVTYKMIHTYRWILNGGSKPDWIMEE